MTSYVAHANGTEKVSSNEDLESFGEVRGWVHVERLDGTSDRFFATQGRKVGYRVEASGALTIVMDDEVYITYGPAAWATVVGDPLAEPRGRR